MGRRLTIARLRAGRLIILTLGAIGLLGAAYYYLKTGGRPPRAETLAEAPVESGSFQPTEAQWKNLKLEPARLVSFRNRREAEGKIAINDNKTTPVFSPYSGRVTRIFVEPGASVQQGQPLFAIEASEFVQAQNDLLSAMAARNKAEAQRRLTEINLGRQHDLFQAKAAAKRDYEQAQADSTAASNDLKTAEIGIEAVRKRLRILGKSEMEVEALTAQGARIDPEAAVLAPISGVVISRKIGLGQYIQAGAGDPVFAIGDLSSVWLVANVRESDIPSVSIGAELDVRVLALPDKPMTAKVVYIAPSVDPATRRLAIRAEIENPGLALKPEMFASFTILAGQEQPRIAVPQSAIVYEGASAHVWVAGKDKRISARSIATGRANGDLIEATSGIAEGEEVVTSGALFIDRAAQQKTSALEAVAARLG
jgi:membrane fusion protein, heavy metal efflux system